MTDVVEKRLVDAQSIVKEVIEDPELWGNMSVKYWKNRGAWLATFNGEIRAFDTRSQAFRWMGSLCLLASKAPGVSNEN